MFKRLYKGFSSPIALSVLNAGLIVILIILNTTVQAFCIPTTWAIIVLTICFLNTIFYTYIEKTRFYPLTSFINGFSLFVFVYCVIFLEQMNLLGLLAIFIGIGLVVFIPQFFVVQLLWRNVFHPVSKYSRLCFLSAIVICIGILLYIKYDYQKAVKSIEQFQSSNLTRLDKNFMTEKILGMHFIYHTRFCEFDGWRPPKHEPILVLGMWLNNRYDPLKVDLKTRLELYKKFFPEYPYKFDCSCAFEYNQDYHQDNLWK